MSPQERRAADDFEMGPKLFSVILAIIFVAVAYVTPVDFSKGRIIAGWLGVFVLVVVAAVFLLTRYGRLGRNTGLGLVAYACIINFTAVGMTLLFDRGTDIPIANHVMYSLVALMVFMGGTGFIVRRASSLIVGGVSIAYLCFLTFSTRDAFLSENLPTLVFFVIGYSVFLFFFRGKLEGILRKLHDSNASLESQKVELSRLKDEAECAYAVLKRTQNRIIAQEKLASLGALTAGIAHEIKNPLNFVTNFAESSVELMDELKVHISKCRSSLSPGDRDEVDYLVGELAKNMSDISEHGRRGDRIVKSMLMHSRGASGVFTSEDMGGLAEECLSLAFHSLRAQDTTFQSAKTLSVPEGLPPVDLVRADFGRVLLNICSNAFYSVHKRRTCGMDGPGYQPEVYVAVAAKGDLIEVVVSDNGLGMSAETRSKLFTPFFTTKAGGEGTGLGLSLSHDIVVQEHGGQIDVESTEGHGARFIISVPLRHHA